MNDRPGSGPGSPSDIFARHPLAGQAYTQWQKGAATALMIGIVMTAARGLEYSGQALTLEMRLLLAMCGLFVVLSYWAVLRSVTVIDGAGVHQSMMLKRAIAWGEIRAVRVVRAHTGSAVSGSAATRLLVRTLDKREHVLHGGCDELAAAFVLIARHYPSA
jgi:hypothetical protein